MAGWKDHRICTTSPLGIYFYVRDGQIYTGKKQGRSFTLSKITPEELTDLINVAQAVLTSYNKCVDTNAGDSTAPDVKRTT